MAKDPKHLLALPTEILQSIFDNLQPPLCGATPHITLWPANPSPSSSSPDDMSRSFPALLTLASVCRRFRTIIFDTPSYKDLDWISLRERNGKHPRAKMTDVDGFIQCFAQNEARMKALQALFFDTVNVSRATMQLILERVNPLNITTVHMTVGTRSGIDESFMMNAIRPLVNTTHLRISAVETGGDPHHVLSDFGLLCLSESLHNLRQFVLHWNSPTITDDGIARLLKANPSLKSLEL
ncbi:hypothetical protein HK104_005092, partial [Borealophlyctis nickersoniae]